MSRLNDMVRVKRPRLTVAAACVVAICLTGCGDDDVSGPPIDAPAAGGVSGGALADVIDVRVVDARTLAPVGDANVTVGRAGTVAVTTTTDAAGRARVQSSAIAGVADVVARAAGYVPSTWIGVRGRAVTVPLTPTSGESTTPVEVTITGIVAATTLVPPVTFDSVEVILAASGAQPASELPPLLQPVPRCTLAPGVDTCTAMIPAASGTRAIVATVRVVDTRGTPDGSDDTRVIAGFGVTRGITITAGARAAIETSLSIASFELQFDASPPGLAGVVGVPGLASPSEGVAFFANEASPAAPRLGAPLAAGTLGDSTFWVLAVTSSATAQSVIIRRGLTSADSSTPLALGAWLPPPVARRGAAPTTVELDPVAAASMYIAESHDSRGNVDSTAVILDSSPAPFTLPALGTGAGTSFTVRALDVTAAPEAVDLSIVPSRLSLTQL